MTKPGLYASLSDAVTRLYNYLAAYGDETPALIVATPLLAKAKPVKPLTIVLPAKNADWPIEVKQRAPRKRRAKAKKR